MKMLVRAEWPHKIDDIVKSLEGVWGVVGAKGNNGNLFRIERSLEEPTTYKVIEYRKDDESDIIATHDFSRDDRELAIKLFAEALGFEFNETQNETQNE